MPLLLTGCHAARRRSPPSPQPASSSSECPAATPHSRQGAQTHRMRQCTQAQCRCWHGVLLPVQLQLLLLPCAHSRAYRSDADTPGCHSRCPATPATVLQPAGDCCCLAAAAVPLQAERCRACSTVVIQQLRVALWPCYTHSPDLRESCGRWVVLPSCQSGCWHMFKEHCRCCCLPAAAQRCTGCC